MRESASSGSRPSPRKNEGCNVEFLRRNLMLRLYFIRWAAAASLLSMGLLITARPAQASDVQITLNNLTFTSLFGSEIFNGSFLVDTGTDEAISSSIDANGLVVLNFCGVDRSEERRVG